MYVSTKKVIAAVALALTVGSEAAVAFESNAGLGTSNFLSLCQVDRQLSGAARAAWVSVSYYGVDKKYSGGSRWVNNTSLPMAAITEQFLSSCGFDVAEGTLVSAGANASSFGAQTIMGFGYRTTAGSWVEYTIGTGTLEPAPAQDQDANVNASAGVTEPIGIDSTVDTSGEARDVFDFTISDGGTSDGLETTVSQIVVNVSGTASDQIRDQITWRLNGNDVSNVTGTYNPSTDKITFPGLSISVADGASETYTINGYFNANTGLTEDQTIILSVDGDTDFTVGASGTQMGSTSAVTNGTGGTIDVASTTLAITQHPAGSTSGSALTTQPIIAAQDAFGNTDVDFTETVTLTESSAGSLTGASVAAVNGVATFSNLAYTATADQQSFTLTANDQDGVSSDLAAVNANPVTSDVVATQLVFATQPSPLSVGHDVVTSFTTVPVVNAVDANNVVDTGYSPAIVLAEVNGAGSAAFSGTGDLDSSTSTVMLLPSSGVATFAGLAIKYSPFGNSAETFNLQVSSGGVTAATSSQLSSSDTTAPVVTSVSVPANGTYVSGQNLDFTVNFSEAISVNTAGGTPLLPVTIGATSVNASYLTGTGTSAILFRYTVQSGQADSDGVSLGSSLSANGGTLRDGAGNNATLTLNSVGSLTSVLVDAAAPSGQSVSFAQSVVNDSNKDAIDFTFADAEAGATYSYTISSSGGGTNVTGSGTISTATDPITGIDLSGLGDGTLTLSVTLTDAASNAATAVTDTISKDASTPSAPSAPLLAIGSNSGSTTDTLTNDTTPTITGTAEANATVEVFVGATSAGTTTADGSGDWSFTFTDGALASGANSITITAADAAGNVSPSSSALTITLDATAPTVALTSNANDPHSGVFTVTATFSEAVTGLTAADIVVVNGTKGTLSGSGTTYTFDVTPTADGAVTVDIAAGVAADAATNGNTAATQLSVTTDATAPTVALTSNANDPHSGVFTVTATFSEAVTGLTAADIVVVNGTKGTLSGSGTTYTFDVTPTADGAVTVDIAAGVAADAATNGNTAATQLSVTTDATAPTVALTSNANDPHSGVFTVTATFSEAVTGLTAADIVVVNGTKGTLSGSGTTYTFDVTPTADGAVTVDIAAGVAADAATNGNTAATQLSVTTDATAPTVALTSNANDPHSGVFTVTATFSEAVTGLTAADIVVVNGTKGTLSGSGTTYTFDVTPTADGAVTVDIAAGVAADAATNGNTAATQLSVTTDGTPPSVTITGPNEVVTEDFTVTFTFSEDVTGFTADDVMVTNGTRGTFAETTPSRVYTLVITPDLGTTVSVSVAADKANDPAGNGNEASNVFEVQAGSPASEFAKYEQEVQQVLVDEASRSLRSSITANQRMTQDARSRFINARQAQAREEEVTRALIPFDVTGNFMLSESGLSAAGNFFQQVGNEEGTYRRLFFGDFDVQHDNDTDSTTATLTGRMAWEHMTSEQTMLGYFIGGELATSTIGGSFEGDQDRIGVTVGSYVVHELAEQVYFDGFASVGAGRNNLEMANDTLALESEYTTQTATLGGAITGVYSQKGYDFKPELAFSYGKTWLGDIGFTGRAYGLTDNTLSLDAGTVSIASLTFRPEVIIPIGADFVADTNTQFSFAPRLVCEQIKSTTTTSDCGTGGELGFSSTSEDGLSSADMRVLLDRIDGGTRSSFAFSVEHKF